MTTPRAAHTRWSANNAALAAFIIATMLIIVSAPYWIGAFA